MLTVGAGQEAEQRRVALRLRCEGGMLPPHRERQFERLRSGVVTITSHTAAAVSASGTRRYHCPGRQTAGAHFIPVFRDFIFCLFKKTNIISLSLTACKLAWFSLFNIPLTLPVFPPEAAFQIIYYK